MPFTQQSCNDAVLKLPNAKTQATSSQRDSANFKAKNSSHFANSYLP